jgi:hypothetical protein
LSTSEKKQEERQQEEAKDAWAMGKNIVNLSNLKETLVTDEKLAFHLIILYH